VAIYTHKRSCTLAAAVVAASLLPLALFAPASFAVSGAGGTVAPQHAGSSPAVKSPAAKKASPPAKAVAQIASVNCVPEGSCSAKIHEVSLQGGQLLVKGQGIGTGMGVAFASRRSGKAFGPNVPTAPRAHLRKTKLGLVVPVPKLARTGRITVYLAGKRHTNLYGPIYITSKKLYPPIKRTSTTVDPSPSGTAFDGQGMWIWYVSQSDGGNVAKIIEQAKADGMQTLYVKSSDGTNWWSQFSPGLIEEVHAAGLKICAWQYVYGSSPVVEAELGAKAASLGADCLVIDAEAEYEGLYASAQRYIQTLRAAVGASYPVGLASFPYVNYHESFPYSVFLGPEGAQFNAPQMYWKDIGVSVESVFSATYEQNLIYGREIEPLGQTFENPAPAEIVAFRTLAHDYGASGLSFWDWQETTSRGWTSMIEPLNEALTLPSPEITAPLLKQGSKGDQVLWLQEHLASVYPSQQVTGVFATETAANLEAFQASKGLPQTGETDATTWGDLLALPPIAVSWTGGSAKA
jgi:hypothetical protein